MLLSTDGNARDLTKFPKVLQILQKRLKFPIRYHSEFVLSFRIRIGDFPDKPKQADTSLLRYLPVFYDLSVGFMPLSSVRFKNDFQNCCHIHDGNEAVVILIGICAQYFADQCITQRLILSCKASQQHRIGN